MNPNALLASVVIIATLAWAIHTRERKGPKYELHGKYEELLHVQHPQQPSEITKVYGAKPSVPTLKTVIALNAVQQ
jgi:hypothetical protein